MSPQSLDPTAELSAAVSTYTDDQRLRRTAGATARARGSHRRRTRWRGGGAVSRRFRRSPGPLYERIVAARPDDARALVILANSYWLTGRGAEATGELAARALAADPDEPRRVASVGNYRRRAARAHDAVEAGRRAIPGGRSRARESRRQRDEPRVGESAIAKRCSSRFGATRCCVARRRIRSSAGQWSRRSRRCAAGTL